MSISKHTRFCYLSYTVYHLIFVASKFGDFKRLTYWSNLVLVFCQLDDLYNYFLF